jgi:Icc-related predicted phosphoesterase
MLFLTDIHGRADRGAKILRQEMPCDLVLIGGDLTQWGGAAEAREVLAPLLAECGENTAIWAVAGNLDYAGVREYLAERGLDIHGRAVASRGVTVMGLGASNPTPMHTPWELGEEELSRLLEKAWAEATRKAQAGPLILMSHTPPHRTKLDRILFGAHVGSSAVRAFLERHSLAGHPIALCLCGHIHESAGEDQVAGAACVNPGAVADGKYCIVETEVNGLNVSRRKL